MIYHMLARNVLSIPLLAAALCACSSESPGAAGSVLATATASADGAAEAGARIYSGNCVPCHQQNGAGISGVYPSLVKSPVVVGDPAALALWVIKGQRPASMPAGRYSTPMPLFGWMKSADAAVLFSYLRSNFGNSAPPIDAVTMAQALGQ